MIPRVVTRSETLLHVLTNSCMLLHVYTIFFTMPHVTACHYRFQQHSKLPHNHVYLHSLIPRFRPCCRKSQIITGHRGLNGNEKRGFPRSLALCAT